MAESGVGGDEGTAERQSVGGDEEAVAVQRPTSALEVRPERGIALIGRRLERQDLDSVEKAFNRRHELRATVPLTANAEFRRNDDARRDGGLLDVIQPSIDRTTGVAKKVAEDVRVEKIAHPLDLDRIRRVVLNFREWLVDRLCRSQIRKEAGFPLSRLDHKPIVFFPHDRVRPRELELPRNANGLVAAVAKEFDVALLDHAGSVAYAET